MKEIESVLVAGAGAIGAMVSAGINTHLPGSVSILAGGERLERYKKGFVINGTPCILPLTDVEGTSNPDLVIIACKYHHLDSILQDLKHHIGVDTLILSLLNGITSEGTIGRAYGAERIPYAMIIGTDANHQENRITFSTSGTIFFGDTTNSPDRSHWSSRVARIARFFDRSGTRYTVPENMLNRLWFKFMMNVGLNQLTAILGKPYQILQEGTKVKEACELYEQAMKEVIAVAAAEGVALTEDDIQETYRVISSISPDGKTSMCQDIEAKRKTEVEMFSRAIMDLGEKHGIPVPVNTVFYRMIRSLEQSWYIKP